MHSQWIFSILTQRLDERSRLKYTLLIRSRSQSGQTLKYILVRKIKKLKNKQNIKGWSVINLVKIFSITLSKLYIIRSCTVILGNNFPHFVYWYMQLLATTIQKLFCLCFSMACFLYLATKLTKAHTVFMHLI